MTEKKQPLLPPVLLLFIGTMILANIAGQMDLPLRPLYVQELGANLRQIGLFFTLGSIAPLLFQIYGGWLSDSIGRLQAIAIGSLGGVMGYAHTALRDLLILRGAPGVDPGLVDAAAREIVELYFRHGEPREAERFFAPLGPEGARLLADLRFRAAGGERLVRPRLPTVLGGDKTL